MSMKIRKAKVAHQIEFKAVNGWGGRRRGAGRPNKTGTVNHMPRAHVVFKKPLHVTLKLANARWNLRCGQIAKAFEKSSENSKRLGLRILHYAILRDHLHLIVEAKSNEALSRGMKSFGGRFGKAIRQALGGVGSVFAGRFHLVVIQSPSQMKRTLAYVLQNFAKHKRLIPHFDRYSSAPYFARWRELLGQQSGPILEDRRKPPDLPTFLSAPRSWLAAEGWARSR